MSRYSTTKRKQKTPRSHLETVSHQTHFELKKVVPLTKTQEKVFDAYDDGKQLVLDGVPGSGKSYIALYLALRDLLSGNNGYDKIIIVRSAVATRNVGFLPGSLKEKNHVFELPYIDICNDLFSNGAGYEVLKAKKLVEFTTTSYLRGLTFENAIVIVDESENLSQHETNTIITRLGDNTKIIFCGDIDQTDFVDEDSGYSDMLNIVKDIPEFKTITFGVDDIVRNGIVKSWILASIGYNHRKLLSSSGGNENPNKLGRSVLPSAN